MVPAKTTDVRTRIVKAALTLLRREGERGLGQVRVAREAGVPQGHLTYYFPRKADLVAAVANEFNEDMAARVQELMSQLDERTTPLEAAVRFVTEHIRDRERVRAMLGLLTATEQDPELRAGLLAPLAGGRPLIAGLMGCEPDDPLVDLAQAAVWGLMAQQLVYDRSESEVEALVLRLASILPSLAAEPEKRRRGKI
jgi:AcrR family transcriptional regulator